MAIAFHRAVACAALLGAALFSGPAAAQSACQRLDGEWTGTMSGRIVGPVSMSVRNCEIAWRLPDGRMNICTYTARGEGMDYVCSLGSRGTVVVERNRLTMRNTYTGDNYTVVFNRQARRAN